MATLRATNRAFGPVKKRMDIQSTFRGMWRQSHADASLEDVPGDLVIPVRPENGEASAITSVQEYTALATSKAG